MKILVNYYEMKDGKSHPYDKSGWLIAIEGKSGYIIDGNFKIRESHLDTIQVDHKLFINNLNK